MEEIFRKACKDKNWQYLLNMMKLYIDNIKYITKGKHILTKIIFGKDIRRIYSIIDRTNRNMDYIRLQVKTSAFLDAILSGDIEVVKCLLERIEYYNKVIFFNNRQILCYACEQGHVEIVKYILNYSINTSDTIYLDIDNDYCFYIACNIENIDIMKYLIEYSERMNRKINLNYRDYYRIILPIKYDYDEYRRERKYKALKYMLYLRKHNNDKCKCDIIACSELFNCKFINNIHNVNIYDNICIFNNTIIHIYSNHNYIMNI